MANNYDTKKFTYKGKSLVELMEFHEAYEVLLELEYIKDTYFGDSNLPDEEILKIAQEIRERFRDYVCEQGDVERDIIHEVMSEFGVEV